MENAVALPQRLLGTQIVDDDSMEVEREEGEREVFFGSKEVAESLFSQGLPLANGSRRLELVRTGLQGAGILSSPEGPDQGVFSFLPFFFPLPPSKMAKMEGFYRF